MSVVDYFTVFLITLAPAWGLVTTLSVFCILMSRSRNRRGLAIFAGIWCTASAALMNLMYMDVLWRNVFYIPIAIGGVLFACFLSHITRPEY